LSAAIDRTGAIQGAFQRSGFPLNSASEDAGLVIAARGGDRDSFGELYKRYGRLIHGVLLARVPFAEVDDLVQDVFLRAMRRLDSLREPAAFGGWLVQIARNCAVDFHRRKPAPQETADEASTADPDRAEALAVLAAIRTLPEAYREPLILRMVEGLTGPEIAGRTGLTHGSGRVNLHRGMKQLREILARSPKHE